MMNKPPSGTVTFLFTDIEGSTQWWEQSPEWMSHAFARQESILRTVAAGYNGYVYKMIGDAFQIAFATALDALSAAVDAQRQLQSETWGELGPLRVRMALHTGVTEEREDDYVGPILNRLGRLLSVSHGGQILLTQATYELVYDLLPEGVDLHDLGQHRLKDLVRPEHIYEVIVWGLLSNFPPIKTLDTFPHNLPLQLTSFVGREKEIVQVKRLLLGDRFVTLTGPGGTGKTRLALQVAAELLELFPDGVWMVELASLADPSLVPQTIAAALEVRESSGRSILNIVTDYLRNKESLLILDNCEHLLSTCAQVIELLLQACPNLCIMATSRESLDIPGEMTFRVPSLSVPETHQVPPIETLTQYESIRLFVERAEAIQPNFVLTNSNASSIAQICQRLDGIPLAIELAVARVKMMPVEQVIARLDNRFRLLTGGSRTALPRHQTLQALIDWSYDLLSDSERLLFQRLSVFAGGWTLDAAETICADGQLQSDEILDLLSQLVNKSLVIPDYDLGVEGRYHLLETIRQYARERLMEAGGGEVIRNQHLSYYLKLVEQAEPELRARNQIEALDRLEKDVDNIRAALEWAVESNCEAGLQMAGELLWFWHIRGRISEGIERLERAISLDTSQHTSESRLPESTLIRGKALNTIGSLLVMHGSVKQGCEYSEESLRLHESLGASGRRGAAHACWNLAQGASFRDDFEGATALASRGLALSREIGDKFGTAQCLDHLGSYALIRGDYLQSKMIWEEDLTLRKELGDWDGIAWILSCLGNLAFWQGDYERAHNLYFESQNGFKQVGNKWAASMAMSGRGSVLLAQGEFDRAAQLYEEALAFGRDMGDQNTIAGRRYDMARVAWARGDYEQAARLYEGSLQILQKLSNRGAVAGTFYDLGSVAWVQGDLDLATRYYEECLAIGREIESPYTIAGALNGLGKVAYSRGDLENARSLFRESLKILQGTRNLWNTAYALEAFITLEVARNQMERAARLFGAIESFFSHLRFLLSPFERDHHEQDVAATRAALGEELAAAYWAEGRAMNIEQAIAYALEE